MNDFEVEMHFDEQRQRVAAEKRATKLEGALRMLLAAAVDLQWSYEDGGPTALILAITRAREVLGPAVLTIPRGAE